MCCFLLLFQRKKSAVSYLNSPLHQGTRKRGPYEINTNLQVKDGYWYWYWYW